MMTTLEWLELVLAVGCIGRFAWGMTRGFVRPHGLTMRMAISGSCGVLAGVSNVVALFWFNRHPFVGTLTGIVLYAVAWLLFEAATLAMKQKPLSFCYSIDAPTYLLNWGPYRLVRHPFYASFLLAWVAGILATGQVLLVIPLGVMFFFYNRAANHEEAKFAASPLAEVYAAYRAQTGKYLPWLPSLYRSVARA